MVNLLEIATGLRFPEGPISMPDGSFLVVEIAAGCLTHISENGTKTTIAKTGGGPNGAAIGPDGKCYICNNGGMQFFEKDGLLFPSLSEPKHPHGWIEAVNLSSGAIDILYTECNGKPLKGPNDIVFDQNGGMWFSDHGHTRRHDRDRGGIYYALIDGSFITEALFPIDSPNGIGISPNGKRLYVTQTFSGRLWVFDIEGPGLLKREKSQVPWEYGHLVASPDGYQLFDSLAIDCIGNICVGSIPGKIDVFSPKGKIVDRLKFPDTFPTNICFGGSDLTTAYVTLSSTGKLVAFDWKQPGCPLYFLNTPSET